MRIGELSRRTGVSARSLRHYERLGLLRASRAGNGYREYDEAAVVRASNIRRLMEIGLTVEDIRDAVEQGCLDQRLTGLPPCEGSVAMAAGRLAVVDRRLAELGDARERLAAELARIAPSPVSSGG